MGISPQRISDGYYNGLQMAIEIIREVAIESTNHDKETMKYLADTCLRSKDCFPPYSRDDDSQSCC